MDHPPTPRPCVAHSVGKTDMIQGSCVTAGNTASEVIDFSTASVNPFVKERGRPTHVPKEQEGKEKRQPSPHPRLKSLCEKANVTKAKLVLPKIALRLFCPESCQGSALKESKAILHSATNQTTGTRARGKMCRLLYSQKAPGFFEKDSSREDSGTYLAFPAFRELHVS